MTALLTVLRTADDDDALSRVISTLSVDTLASEAALHGLAGLIRWWVADHVQDRRLDAAATSEAAFVLQAREALTTALDALAQRSIVPVLLKGYGFGARYYPEPLLRFTRDVDLLVTSEEFPAAVAALSAAGFSPGKRRAESLELAGRAGSVDLHTVAVRAFGLELPSAPLFSRAIEVELLGRAVRYLSPEDELLYLSVHAGNHLLQRIAWLYDLKLLAEDPLIDWAVFLSRIEPRALGGIAWLALDAAHRELRAAIPSEVLTALEPSRSRQRVARAALSAKGITAQALWGRRLPWALVKAALAPGPMTLIRWSARELAERVAPSHPRG